MNAKLARPLHRLGNAPSRPRLQIPPTLWSPELAVALSEVSNPFASRNLRQRRALLAKHLARTTQSDAWLWLETSRRDDLDHGQRLTQPASVQSGGFRNLRQRTEWVQAVQHPRGRCDLIEILRQSAERSKNVTMSRSHLMTTASGRLDDIDRQLNDGEIDDFIVCGQFNAPLQCSCCSFIRFRGRPQFTQIEVDLVAFVSSALNWVYAWCDNLLEQPDSSIAEIPALSPRERQVTDLVLAGYSRKQVAQALGLSEHTIVGYLKTIYRKFGVNTRAQLQALKKGALHGI